MRQAAALALMTAVFLCFCACGGGENAAGRIQREYAAMERLSFIADVSADYGERVYEYRLRVTCSGGETALEVLAPESIKGVSARTEQGKVKLIFEGAEIDTGALFGGGLSPLSAMPLMTEAWKRGYVTASGSERMDGEAAVMLEFDLTEAEDGPETTHRAWFGRESALPIYAEICADGRRVIACRFANVITE